MLPIFKCVLATYFLIWLLIPSPISWDYFPWYSAMGYLAEILPWCGPSPIILYLSSSASWENLLLTSFWQTLLNLGMQFTFSQRPYFKGFNIAFSCRLFRKRFYEWGILEILELSSSESWFFCLCLCVKLSMIERYFFPFSAPAISSPVKWKSLCFCFA